MRTHPVAAALAFLAVMGAAVAHAQEPAGGIDARLVAGIARQHGMFGDDNPKLEHGVSMALGAHLLTRRSDRFAWVFEGVLHPSGLPNPHFDETLSSLFLQFGPELGRRLHVRPTFGIAIQNWSGTRSCGCLDVAPAGAIAVGIERAAGSSVRITPELFARGSIAPGIFTSSVGVQVGVGWR